MTAGELPISMAMGIQRITETRLLTQPIHPSVTKVKECNCDILRFQSDQMCVMQEMKDHAITSKSDNEKRLGFKQCRLSNPVHLWAKIIQLTGRYGRGGGFIGRW